MSQSCAIQSRASSLLVVHTPTKDTQMRRDNWDDGDVHLLLEMLVDDRVQAKLEDTGQNRTTYRCIADCLNCMLAEGGGQT